MAFPRYRQSTMVTIVAVFCTELADIELKRWETVFTLPPFFQ